MSKKKKNKSNKVSSKEGRISKLILPGEVKKWIFGIFMLLIAAIFVLSFFNLSGIAGETMMRILISLIGKATFSLPLVLIIGGLVFLTTKYKKVFFPTILATLILIIGLVGVLECFKPGSNQGGLLGFIITWPFLRLFGFLVAKIVFGTIILIGSIIFWYLLKPAYLSEERRLEVGKEKGEEKKTLITKIFRGGMPKFKVKEIESFSHLQEIRETTKPLEIAPVSSAQPLTSLLKYEPPPLELLEPDKGSPTSGDTRINSAIIKKTLENFDISVEMSEVNIGPTVTQYTLKPADGVKLSKITGLSNNLSLALAAHPIRIEAPIPGKALVGIEVPNKIRVPVRLRDLLSDPNFQKLPTNLFLVLGRDVSGNPIYTDLSRMPHLLVAGSTGTGKTIFLNSLILNLLYRNSPEILRFILVDPKRVEFTIYNNLPHLLCPVIVDVNRTVNALKWLTLEMERRFDVLSATQARDILSYNEKVRQKGEVIMPYIIIIIDELADLMAAKGRDIEAGIVRLAQMARAVGIHLVVATQRPSVDVITGLIKANITSRVTFQVASQVDSRTVLDMAGAEKLLGAGDLLFISAEVSKPRRIQGVYVSEKEVRKVVSYINTQNSKLITQKIDEGLLKNHLAEDLEKSLEMPEEEFNGSFGDDQLYEEARRIVIEARKASASLLQRRLRIGYARAARLIDMLEENGVVGPGEGAKPREVYFDNVDNKESKIV